MKVLKVDEDKKTIQIELSQADLDSPIATLDGNVIAEVEVANSRTWCNEEPHKVGMRVGQLIADGQGMVTEVIVRAGMDWKLRTMIPLEKVMSPMGLPIEGFKGTLEESKDAASRLHL